MRRGALPGQMWTDMGKLEGLLPQARERIEERLQQEERGAEPQNLKAQGSERLMVSRSAVMERGAWEFLSRYRRCARAEEDRSRSLRKIQRTDLSEGNGSSERVLGEDFPSV